MTVFSTDAKLLGYNLHIPTPAASGEVGNARTQAVGSLGSHGSVIAVFMSSQDGQVTFKKLNHSASNALIPWQSAKPALVPKDILEPAQIVDEYAITLRTVDKRSLVNAFKRGDYAMGAGHLWRRSIARLRERIGGLGMRFLGEMLNREDITEQSSPDAVLTDHDTIFLAEALGFVDFTGAMRLRHGFEVVSHFDSERATEEMSLVEAGTVVRVCVQYVFGPEESATAIGFSHFRERLSSEGLKNR